MGMGLEGGSGDSPELEVVLWEVVWSKRNEKSLH